MDDQLISIRLSHASLHHDLRHELRDANIRTMKTTVWTGYANAHNTRDTVILFSMVMESSLTVCVDFDHTHMNAVCGCFTCVIKKTNYFHQHAKSPSVVPEQKKICTRKIMLSGGHVQRAFRTIVFLIQFFVPKVGVVGDIPTSGELNLRSKLKSKKKWVTKKSVLKKNKFVRTCLVCMFLRRWHRD